MALIKSFETGGTLDEPIGDLDNNEYDQAQSFVLDATATVTKVSLYLKKVNTITDAITLRIETNAAGPKPSGTLANANASDTEAPSNTSYGWVDFVFATPFSLTGSTKYWIVCTVPNQAAQNRYDWQRSNSNGYADGGMSTSFNGGAWGNESSTADLYFRIYDASSPSASPSLSPSLSPSASPSLSPSLSPSVSESLSPSLSPSASISLSPSESGSPSPSASISLSPSASPSLSPSASLSPSSSESLSPSLSESLSPSVSESLSISSSESVSISLSPSASVSPSPSASISSSPSASESASVSPSQPPGDGLFSKEALNSLPTNKDNLDILYGEEDEEDVSSSNDVRVPQSGSTVYLAHQYRFVNNTNKDNIQIKVELQSTRAPSAAAIILQVWNEADQQWENLASNNSANANLDIELAALIDSNIGDYYDSSYEVAFRVYQETGGVSQTLSVDLVELCWITVWGAKYSSYAPTYTPKYTSKLAC